MPAPDCTRTVWPCAFSFFAVSGVTATRVSPAAVSSGTPISILPPRPTWIRLSPAARLVGGGNYHNSPPAPLDRGHASAPGRCGAASGQLAQPAEQQRRDVPRLLHRQ